MRLGLAGMAAAAFLLAACGNYDKSAPMESTQSVEGYAAMAPAPPPAPIDNAARGGAAGEMDVAQEEAGPRTETPGSPAPVMFLAYAYQIGFELPGDRLIGVMDAHVRACQDAGPRQCQLVGSQRSGDPETQLYGSVSLRGEPQWLRAFMDGLEAQAEQAGGKITSTTTSTEDLTRQIVDTESMLRAQRTLRERLQNILASRPGRLADLLEVERELARVQAQIDAAESSLAVMRTRVSMSELTLSYQSSPRPLRADTFEPLTQAFADFLRWIVVGFAAIVTLVAVLLPWALVLGLVGWLALKWRKRRGGRFFRRKPKTEPPETPTEA